MWRADLNVQDTRPKIDVKRKEAWYFSKRYSKNLWQIPQCFIDSHAQDFVGEDDDDSLEWFVRAFTFFFAFCILLTAIDSPSTKIKIKVGLRSYATEMFLFSDRIKCVVFHSDILRLKNKSYR